jgi:hypothetical protein
MNFIKEVDNPSKKQKVSKKSCSREKRTYCTIVWGNSKVGISNILDGGTPMVGNKSLFLLYPWNVVFSLISWTSEYFGGLALVRTD